MLTKKEQKFKMLPNSAQNLITKKFQIFAYKKKKKNSKYFSIRLESNNKKFHVIAYKKADKLIFLIIIQFGQVRLVETIG